MENKWEEEFDKQFGIVFGEIFRADIDDTVLERREKDIKAFIKNEIEKVSAEYEGKITEAREEGALKGRLMEHDHEHIKERAYKKGYAEARTEALEEIKRELEGHRVELHDHGTEDVCCGIALGRNDEIDKSIKAIEALNTKEENV